MSSGIGERRTMPMSSPASTTLVLHPRYDDDSQLLWQEAVRRGWAIERLDGYFAPAETVTRLVESERVVIYGGAMWGEHVAAQLGVTLLSPPADWLVTLPEQFTRRWVKVSTVGEVREGAFGWPVFVKSLHGKSLASRVYVSADDLPDVGDDVQVIAQEPVEWAFEYRTFLSGAGFVTTMSRYASNGDLDVGACDPRSAEGEEIEDLVDGEETLFPRWAVVDAGHIKGRGMAVVEANPAWCSAVYGCDPAKVLDVVAGACIRQRSSERAIGVS
jgi:ATP-grasp domain, R2K clade family 2